MRRRQKGLFLFWNILFKVLGPGALALSLEPLQNGGTRSTFGQKRPVYKHHSDSFAMQSWTPFTPTTTLRQPSIISLSPTTTPQYSRTVVHYYFIPEPLPPPPAIITRPPPNPKFKYRRANFHPTNYEYFTSNHIPPPPFKKKQDLMCDGKANLLQDLGVLAIVTGAVGTLMGIFSASYLSVVGNTISVFSGIISFVLGIPAAIITYLAASDRLTYSVANVLSVLSLANTFYSFWSVDFGNKDIMLSQFANAVGIFSLVLSIITAYPRMFDEILIQLERIGDARSRRDLRAFVAQYGCEEGGRTFYQYSESLVAFLNSL